MITSTLLYDSQMEIVGVGSAFATGPLLPQTTHLLDQSGPTTAVLPLGPTVVSNITPVRPSTATSSRTALSSTGTGGVPAGWGYRGCYIDYPNARVLPMRLADNPILTPYKCVSSCYQLGYSIASLEYRRECFCGNSIYNGGTLARNQSDCNMSCSGNAMEACGGRNRSSIYSNGSVKMYQSEVVHTSIPTTTTTPAIAPASTPTPTNTTSQTLKMNVTVAAVFGGVAIMIALVYLYWRIRGRTKRPQQISQSARQARRPADRVPSWEDFSEATEEYYAKFDESMMDLREGGRSGLSPQSLHVEHRPSMSDLRKTYEVQLNNLQVYQAGSNSSHKYVVSPRKHLPTSRLAVKEYLGQTTSILKRPETPASTVTAQGTFELEDSQVSNITGNLARAKKGVRFGVNQIREFGRTPVIGHGSDSSDSSR